MSRIPTASSRIPTKSSSSLSATSSNATSSFTTINRPTSALSSTTTGLTSTRTSGLAEPKKFGSTSLASASYDADAGSVGSTGSAGLTSSAAIREFAANTTIAESSSLGATSSLRRPSTQQSLLTSTHRSISSSSSAGEKAAFQVDATVTRKPSESSSTSGASSSLLIRKTSTTSSGLVKPSLTSTRTTYASDNDNSSTNSAGSGTGTARSGTTSGLARTSQLRSTNASALAATVSSALQSVKDIADATKLVSTRPTLGAKSTSSSASLPKPPGSSRADDLHEKIPGVSRERQVIMGGRPTAKESQPSIPLEQSKIVPEVLPPIPPSQKSLSEQDIDNLDLKTFLAIFTSQTPNQDNSFIPSKDLPQKEIDRIVNALVQNETKSISQTSSILDDPSINQMVEESNWIIKKPYKIKLSTLWREHYSIDVIDQIQTYHEMTKAQLFSLSDPTMEEVFAKYMNDGN